MLLVVCGLVASGKSTVTRLLSARTGFSVLDSDRVRKKLAGISPTTHARENYRSGIYTEQFTRLTYESLLNAAEAKLADAQGVITDATFSDPRHRRRVAELAGRFNVPLLLSNAGLMKTLPGSASKIGETTSRKSPTRPAPFTNKCAASIARFRKYRTPAALNWIPDVSSCPAWPS